VQALRSRGGDVFLDLKFHDIPNTVAGGVRNAAAMGARLVTVHASGGRAMLEAAVKAAGPECGVLAVTVLTSLDAKDVGEAWGRSEVDVSAEVMRLAHLAANAGCHGIVCSGQEAGRIRDEFGQRLATLVPGIRAREGETDDQARVVTPEGVAAAGARYAVVGRMVTAAEDRRAAMEQVRAALT
jgi:orotidine-5'-phosphate decarboxylase